MTAQVPACLADSACPVDALAVHVDCVRVRPVIRQQLAVRASGSPTSRTELDRNNFRIARQGRNSVRQG
jgi:hypothetical protein